MHEIELSAHNCIRKYRILHQTKLSNDGSIFKAADSIRVNKPIIMYRRLKPELMHNSKVDEFRRLFLQKTPTLIELPNRPAMKIEELT